MKRNLILSLTLVLASAMVTVPALSQDSSFSAALSQAKEDPSSADFDALRRLWVEDPAYNAYYHVSTEYRDSRSAMFKALHAEEYKSAYRSALKILDVCYLDIEAHFFAAEACDELPPGSCSPVHRPFAKGLIESILNSGDGNSPESAYVVISLPEEWAVLSTFGYPPKAKQSLQFVDDTPYDMLVQSHVDTGVERTFYFDISAFFGKY